MIFSENRYWARGARCQLLRSDRALRFDHRPAGGMNWQSARPPKQDTASRKCLATCGPSHLRPFTVNRICTRPGRNERQRAAGERDVLHEVLELIQIAELQMPDEG